MAQLLRSTVMTMDAWFELRFKRKFQSWPLRLVETIDYRLTEAKRQETRQAFCDASDCCLDAGFGKRLRDSGLVIVPSDFEREVVQGLLEELSCICLNNGSTECLHARNGQHCSKNTSWESFFADYLLSSSAAASSLCDHQRAQVAACHSSDSSAGASVDAGRGRRRRQRHLSDDDNAADDLAGFSAKQVFQQACLRSMKGVGGAQIWAHVTWDSFRMRRWDDLADVTLSIQALEH